MDSQTDGWTDRNTRQFNIYLLYIRVHIFMVSLWSINCIVDVVICHLWLWMKRDTRMWHTQCVRCLKQIFVWFYHNWPALTSRPWLLTIWQSTGHQLSIGWLSAIYWLAIGYLLAGYRLSIGWLLAIYQLAIHVAGHGLAMGWLLAGYGLALRWLCHGMAMGWLLTGYGLAIGSPPFDIMTIVFKYWIAFYQY